ncbi:MAG TPA: hypothetical protein DCW31_06535 [Lactobacillus sp.]|nr:hypothetical protein [Lactobacillus sp.]
MLIIKDFSQSQLKITKSFVTQGALQKVENRLLIDSKWTPNDMLVRQLLLDQGIYYGPTALYLWGLSGTFPYQVYMAFKTGYKLPLKQLGKWTKNVTVKQLSKEILNTDVETLDVAETTQQIKVYSRERTLVDLIRNHTEFDTNTINMAFKNYANSQDKKMWKLAAIAAKFNVANKIDERMSILL